MAIQTINIGNRVNDGLGDDLRTAFEKVNANFTELQTSLTVTASNTGSTGVGVFKDKVGADLRFKSLVSGSNMFLDEREDTIIINNTAPDAFIRIDTDAGVVLAADSENITIQGGENVSVTAAGQVITIDSRLDIGDILTNIDFGTIGGSMNYTTQLALAAANVDFGLISNQGTISFDFGSISV